MLCFYVNVCLFYPRCLQSTHSLHLAPFILSSSVCTLHYYCCFTGTVFPLLANNSLSFSFCYPIATSKGLAVRKGLYCLNHGVLVSDTIQPFGVTSCHHLHDTAQFPEPGHHRLKFSVLWKPKCCAELLLFY